MVVVVVVVAVPLLALVLVLGARPIDCSSAVAADTASGVRDCVEATLRLRLSLRSPKRRCTVNNNDAQQTIKTTASIKYLGEAELERLALTSVDRIADEQQRLVLFGEFVEDKTALARHVTLRAHTVSTGMDRKEA